MDYNLMFSNGHVTVGTSADNIFDKNGHNKNSLHYKYNQFLISPYLERKFITILIRYSKIIKIMV